ncbi:unnamed protein product [Dicrocoelium dendriticum]|nr:unnamed protein product [Dicrocoelium dendriticum]
MAPGGEFRAAAAEASKLPHCHLVLADRPISVTLQRAFNSLGPWTKLKLIYALLFSLEPITKEQVEEMKKSDFLEKTLMEMAGDHPELTRVLLDERDMFLAKSIWSTTGMSDYKAAIKSTDGEVIHPANHLIEEPSSTRFRVPFGDRKDNSTHSPTRSPDARTKSDSCDGIVSNMQSCCPYWPCPSVLPRVVVAIVGIGHVAGIKRYWDIAGTIDQAQLMTVIQPPLSWRVFKWSLRVLFVSTLAAAAYGCIRGAYKLSTSVFHIRT